MPWRRLFLLLIVLPSALLAFLFGGLNATPVELNWLFGHSIWPLSALLMLVFALGSLFGGGLASVLWLGYQRRKKALPAPTQP
jgi:uncharacterized integral membrane protein